MRKAFGPQRPMTAMQKARHVAESILAHGLDTTDLATWKRYGLDTNPAQQALVLAALTGKKE